MADRRIVLTMDPRSHGQITAWLAGTDIGKRLRHVPGRAKFQ